MNKALSFVRLDFITVKPYLTLKNFIIYSMVALIMMISSGGSVSAISILMMYAVLYVSYPFAVSEKNGIDTLYATLSIKRDTVVLGRYLFALIMDVCSGFIAYFFAFAVLTAMQKGFDTFESLIVTLVMFLLYSIIQAIQLPFYFKLGYTKAKLIVYMPIIGLGLITVAVTNMLKANFSLEQITVFFSWLTSNPHLSALCGVVIWIGIMAVSYKVSLSYYSKREF